jgi:uncharacterized membrane protein
MSENSEMPAMAQIVQRNIRALLERRLAEEKNKGLEQRIADTITRFTGRILFVYIHLVLFGIWIVWNLPWLPLPKFDPTFVVLAMFASVEAIFLSTFVLISQNRMTEQANKRADLDLQVSLLAEHEVTRLITLVKAIAAHLQVRESDDPELGELQQDVAPERVLDVMEKHQRDFSAEL